MRSSWASPSTQLPWLVLGLLLVLLAAPPARGQNKFRLKPGATGKVCLDCHDTFTEKLKSKFVHTPVKDGDCTGCHSPHTSAHGKLLSAPTRSICLTCHDGIIPAGARSSHKVALEGSCTKCHDPHAASNKANLRRAGNDLCLECHKAMGDTVAKVKFKHLPVSDSCLNCHDPHASEKAQHLLKQAVPVLCLECHKADAPSFVRQHANYPMARALCTSCHEPHGSNVAAILYDTVHPPVAAKRCNQCHEAPIAAEPFKTKRPGFELCRGCHATMVNEVFSKSRVHWPLVDRVGCLNCHQAHASRHEKLLKMGQERLCGRCHQDTLEWQAKLAEKERQEKSASRVRVEKGAFTHPPIQEGNCAACHAPHSADSTFLLRNASVVDGCGTCHDWLKHNSHPMGEKYADMRNKNLFVNCLSCHRSHGTGYRYMIPFPTATDLCVQCHKQLRR